MPYENGKENVRSAKSAIVNISNGSQFCSLTKEIRMESDKQEMIARLRELEDQLNSLQGGGRSHGIREVKIGGKVGSTTRGFRSRNRAIED